MAKAAAVAIGTIVTHAKLGSGKVIAVDGDKLSIEFAHGRRQILARFVTWSAPVAEKPTRQALLDEVLANPDDDAPRLAYADLLQEANDPRGEFIVMQCAGLTADELLARHRADWTHAFDQRGTYRFARGFIRHAKLEKPKHAASLLAHEPVEVIEISLDEIGAFLALEHVERLPALHLVNPTGPSSARLDWLAESRRMTKLETLILSSTKHHADDYNPCPDFRPLAEWKHERLAHLGLLDLDVTLEVTARELADISTTSLELVVLDDAHWTPPAFEVALARWSSIALALPAQSRRIPELERRGYTATAASPSFLRAFERMGWQDRTVWTR